MSASGAGPPLVDVVARVLAGALPDWPRVRLWVALSGGVDSVVLLDVCRRLRGDRAHPLLRAVHVHHGLQSAADGWQEQCDARCRSLAIPFVAVQARFCVPPGASVEAVARSARYDALRSLLAPGDVLLTAHHQDDQFETVLLQLFRGAGAAGLAAMPVSKAFGAGRLVRPLLGVPRAEIEAHARAAALTWVDDPSNASPHLDRAFLRLAIAPTLRERWPGIARTVSRSARHLADARQLLDDLARVDAGDRVVAGRLHAGRIADLARPRQANLLRWWLRQQGLGLPSSARLGAILDDLVPARADARPVVRWPTGEVRRHRGWLHAMRPLAAATGGPWTLIPGKALAIDGMGTVALEAATGRGLSAARFPGPFEIRLRHGGERLRPAGKPGEKSVIRLLREARMESWLRDRVPLLYWREQLVAVGDRWLAAGTEASRDEPGLVVQWAPGAAGG